MRMPQVFSPSSASLGVSALATGQASRGGAGAESDDLPAHQFRAFYAELQRARDSAMRCTEEEALPTAQALAKQLIQIIELHTVEARRLAGRGAMEIESDARYLKAALADEVFLNLDWPGRVHWRHVLLEAQLVRSSVAGERVFDNIDALLRAREPAGRAVAALYLNVLALGFQGRLRGAADAERLSQYRRELFQFIAQRDPQDARAGTGLSPQAYAHTAGHLAKRRIPRLSRWTVGLLLAALLMLGLSELLWLWRSWPLRHLLESAVVLVAPNQSPSG
jgi:type VI secretion system protein ImpK